MKKRSKACKNKSLIFERNVIIATLTGIIAGAIVAEIAHSIAHNHTTIAIASTLAMFIAGTLTFPLLHALSNLDIYYTGKGKFNLWKFKWKDFIIGQLKLTVGFGIIDLFYFLGRTFLVRKFLYAGLKPSISSTLPDVIFYVVLFSLAVPIGRFTGNIRTARNKTKSSLEERVYK